MDSGTQKTQRRSYRWSKQARDLVSEFLNGDGDRTGNRRAQIALITQLVAVTGYPRHACSRFLRQSQNPVPSDNRPWTREEKQKLLDYICAQPVQEVARLMHRSPSAVRSMLHRLGASAQMGKDWFTKYTLARALRLRAEEVQRWIDLGWLKHRIVETDDLKRQIIEADAFTEFCRKHRAQIIGRRIDPARLDFVQSYVFPPSHSDLLPVRESKKERAAYERSHSGKLPPPDELDEEAKLSA